MQKTKLKNLKGKNEVVEAPNGLYYFKGTDVLYRTYSSLIKRPEQNPSEPTNFPGLQEVTKSTNYYSSEYNLEEIRYWIPTTDEKLYNSRNSDPFDRYKKRYDNHNSPIAMDFLAKKAKATNMLENFGVDITKLARKGLLAECYGRDKELSQLMEILVRRQKNNPVLVGDAGVGKTAIIELFAQKLVTNQVPFILDGRSIVNIDLSRIIGGSRYRGEFELRFQKILDEVLQNPHIIIFIDEIHNISGTGSAEGSLDAANILKPVLSRSGFQCIGSTTTKEYQKIEKDPALNRRFQPINVKESSIQATIDILYGLRPSLESFHNVVISPDALVSAAELADRFIPDRFLPDKAIDLLDRAASRAVIKATSKTSVPLLASIVNAVLQKIGKLKGEAYRKGDTATEFLIQEVENAYRYFLLAWVDEPLLVPQKIFEAQTERREEFKKLSEIYQKTKDASVAESVLENIHERIISTVDDILFNAYKPAYILL